MATTTVRLDDDDEHLLDELATEFGGRSNALRQGLRELGADRARRRALGAFLAEWEADAGPIDEVEVDALAARYGL